MPNPGSPVAGFLRVVLAVVVASFWKTGSSESTTLCGSNTWSAEDDRCELWRSDQLWTKGTPPTVGDLVVVVPPPGETSACAVVDDDAFASEVLVESAADLGTVQIRVKTGGRLVISGDVTAAADGSLCDYPTKQPSVSPAPSVPSIAPSRSPTPAPSPMPRPVPSMGPTPGDSLSPTMPRHMCGGVAWSDTTGACSSWDRDQKWSTGKRPAEGDVAEIALPPGTDKTCVVINGIAHTTDVIVSKSRDDDASVQLRVAKGGRLVLSGTVAPSSALCAYPSPVPTVSFQPSVPTAEPTHLPTPLPTQLPTPLPSTNPTPVPSPAPTMDRLTHTCGAASVTMIADDFGSCGAKWSDTSTWLHGFAPTFGSLFEAWPPLAASSACVTVDVATAEVSKILVSATDTTRMRIVVGTGSQLRVRGTPILPDPKQCVTPTVMPTISWSPSAKPVSSPTARPSALRQTSLPTLPRHHCGGVAWNEVDGACSTWDTDAKWSAGAVPTTGDLVEVIPQPGSDDACILVRDVAFASEVLVQAAASSSSGSSQIRVSAGGRLVISGDLAVASDAMCPFPTPPPTVSFQPSTPTFIPTHLPSPVPSALPTPVPSYPPSPMPSSVPTLLRDTHTCGASSVIVIDDGLKCGAKWSNPATWLQGLVRVTLVS